MKRIRKLIILKVENEENKRDVAGSKLLKAFEYVKKRITELEFEIKDAGWDWDEQTKAMFWIYIVGEELSETKEIKGPPIELEKHAKIFKKKYKKTSVKKGIIYATIKRKDKIIDNAIKSIVKEEYYKEKVKKTIIKIHH